MIPKTKVGSVTSARWKGLATERLERGGAKQREKEKWRTRSTVIHIHCGCSLRVCVDGQTGERERERRVDRYCCVVSCRVCVKGTNVLCHVTLFLVVYRQLVPFFVVNSWKRKMMLWFGLCWIEINLNWIG
jgi:hypothetical protein